MKNASIVMLAAALAACATPPIDPAPLESSFVRGRELLAAAVETHGGEARISAMTAARLHLAGELSTGLQGPRRRRRYGRLRQRPPSGSTGAVASRNGDGGRGAQR